MLSLPNIGYGTWRYPEQVARRLRVLNIATWMAAALTAGFAVMFYLSPAPGVLNVAVYNAVASVLLASIPLLHRFGPLVGPLTFGVIGYAAIFVVCSEVGTDTGMPMQYLVVMAIMIAIVGTEHVFILAAFGVLSAILIVALEVLVPGDTGIQPRAHTFASFLAGAFASCAILFAIVFYALRDTARAEAAADREYLRSESLLHNILPASVADRLKTPTGQIIADKFDTASILFADMAGFTARASDTPPEELVLFLNRVFTGFDRLAESHGLEKIKTTGDSYMVVSGVPNQRPDHAEVLADFALAMRDEAAALRDPQNRLVPLRIGIASGPVVAGVVGTLKIFYDVWGDAVNVASRMESTGEAGMIQVAPQTFEHLKEKFELRRRGPVDVKGKGQMVTWMLVGRKPGC